MHQNSHFKTLLSALPHSFQTSFFNQLNSLINYSPTIGLMGKTGAGKSSLINALFQSPLSPVSNVSGCTRQAQRFNLTISNHTLTFVDLPGVGESFERDREYHSLYRNLLPELDLIICVAVLNHKSASGCVFGDFYIVARTDGNWQQREQEHAALTRMCKKATLTMVNTLRSILVSTVLSSNAIR